MSRRDRAAPPLFAYAGVGAIAGGLLVVAVTIVLPVVRGHRWPREALNVALVGGIATTVLVGLSSAWLADLFAARLRKLRRASLTGISDPELGQVSFTPFLDSKEVADLARTMDALLTRARVADEVAEMHRRTAENASAGVFELLSGLVAAEEGARGQLAAELHDTVAQSLALGRAELAMGDPESVARAAELVAESEEHIRAVMSRTRPPALRDGDLATAIDSMRRDLEHRYGLNVDLRWPTQPYPLPLVSAITLYRFFQEALLNVVKHADVDDASASLEVTEDSVYATVSDAGSGFVPAEVRSEKGRHVGLGLMRERARLAGGTVELTSGPTGTTVRLRLPRNAGTTSAARSLPSLAPRQPA